MITGPTVEAPAVRAAQEAPVASMREGGAGILKGYFSSLSGFVLLGQAHCWGYKEPRDNPSPSKKGDAGVRPWAYSSASLLPSPQDLEPELPDFSKPWFLHL